MNPDWPLWTNLCATLANLVANTQVNNLASVVRREMGQYESGKLASFPGFNSTTIMVSFIEAGKIPVWNASLYTFKSMGSNVPRYRL